MVLLWLATACSLSSWAAAGSFYDQGMALRKKGDYEGAKKAFLQMQAENPDSGGALEGLTLAEIGLGEYEQALASIERWEKLGDSAYIQSLKARVLGQLGLRVRANDALARQHELDPADLAAARRLDNALRQYAPGVFASGGVSKTLSQEGLGTPAVSRIVYEGRSSAVSSRLPLARGLTLLAGGEVRQSAQRNDSVGFTYFDILEQVYSAGLEARGRRAWGMTQYGQSVLSDNKVSGIGYEKFSRVQVQGGVELGDLELRAYGERSPYFARGAGGSRFFALLRQDSARVEAEVRRWGVGWLARAGVADFSDHLTAKNASLSGVKEGGSYLVAASFAHSYQEFFGAGATGQLSLMPLDRLSVRGQKGPEGVWQVSAGYARCAYRDGNRENDAGAEGRVWAPRLGGLGEAWASYRFFIDEFLTAADGYRSSDSRGHWSGLFWRRQWAGGPWTKLGYEHGFLNDSRGSYEGNAWTAELEWYRRRALSLTAQGRLSNTSVRDQSQSAGLQGRWSF